MNLSAPFIYRPIATTLLAIGLAIAGICAFNFLPVSSLPQVEFPTILVQATLTGSSAETMASSVVTPIEKSLSRIAGIADMTSSSTPGNAKIIIQFDLSRNIDGAARDVQAAIDAAKANLPSNMTQNPTYRKVNPADAPIMVFALTSNLYPPEEMYDIASTTLQQKLLKVEGVGQVIIAGSSLPSVRVELNPNKLNSYGISLSQVSSVISSQNQNLAKGQITKDNLRYELTVNDELFDPEEYKSMIIKNNKGAIVRLADIAEVSRSVQDVKNNGIMNGKRAVLLVIFKSPGANVIETNDRLKEAFFSLREAVPRSMEMDIVIDRSSTVKASLHDVKKTMFLAMIFVVIVVYLFLGNFHSMIIPGVAMALSLLGTCCVMWLLGFSLNILSLMALTIATGFVVDDAIVVLENISRHIEEGKKAFEAAILGSKEIGFTVTSISISLIAVFIPILLMGGIVGKLFREFAVTLSVAIIISLIVSLTLTPMMCAYMLEYQKHQEKKETMFDKVKLFYQETLRWSLEHSKTMLFLTFVTIALNIFLYAKASKGLFPQQDTGRIVATIITDQNSSFKNLNGKLKEFLEIIAQDPAAENVFGYIASGSVNTATTYIVLKDYEQRKISADLILDRIRNKLKKISGATLYMQVSQDLVIGGRQSNAQYQYTISGDNIEEVNAYAPRIMELFRSIPGITDVNSDQGNFALKSYVKINREKAYSLGIDINTIDNTLQYAFGQSTVSTMYGDENQYYVVMELAPEYNNSPKFLNDIYVNSNSGILIPLSTIATFEDRSTFLNINHQGLFPCATISFNLLPGVHLGDSVILINQALEKIHIPITIQGSFRGAAQAFQDSLSGQVFLILAALMAVYVILGMLYENLRHPLTILSSLPSAGVGALLALMITNTDLSIIAMIGIILLIGIVKKNAIMMIDFVIEIKKTQNISPREAIFQGAVLRFRPIMMTTMAALLGAVPMAISTGLGAEMQRPLGITIIGGLIVSQILTLYTTPVIYLAIENFGKKRSL